MSVQQLVIRLVASPAVLPFLVGSLYFPVPQMLEASAEHLPAIFVQQVLEQLEVPAVHVQLDGLEICCFPAAAEHVTSAQVALVVQQLVIRLVASPAMLPFLAESLYFPEGQVMVVLAHVPAVGVQQVLVVQLETALLHAVDDGLAIFVYPAGHV